MVKTIAQVTALLAVAVIIFVTLSPIDLRPRTGHVGLERAAAFALLAVTSTVSFPAHFWIVVGVVFSIAIGLEFAQHFTPDRHGEVTDVMQKLAGAVVGAAAGYLINRFAPF